MFSWVPVSLVLFACLKPRHALLAAYVLFVVRTLG